MKEATRVRLFLLAAVLFSCTAASVDIVPKIVASAGETVLLPCNTTASDDVPTVEWSKEGLPPIIAFLYRDGCETFEMKNQVFWYRTNLIRHELHHGNLSMVMSNVQPKDSGKYQCAIRKTKKKQVITTLELFVGAVSEPKLTVVPGVGGGVTLQCEAKCWFPEPVITLLDHLGNEISAEDPKREENTLGCLTVIRRVTQIATNRVTCKVHQPEINQTRDLEIYIPDECLRSYTVIIASTVVVTTIIVVCICALLAFVVKRHYFSAGEQKFGLDNKRLSQVQQPIKFTNDPRSSPGTSKPDIPPPPKSPHNSNPLKPASSVKSSRPKSDSLPQTKDSKPVVSGQNPARSPQMKRSSHGGSSAVSTNDGAVSFIPPPDSKEKPLPRSMSMSENRPRIGGVRPQRRNTLSVMSNNPFSVLADLSEDPEDSKPLI